MGNRPGQPGSCQGQGPWGQLMPAEHFETPPFLRPLPPAEATLEARMRCISYWNRSQLTLKTIRSLKHIEEIFQMDALTSNSLSCITGHTSVECIIAICDELYELATCVEEQPLFFGGCFRPAQHSILSPVALRLLSAARWKLGWTRDWVGLGRAGSTFPRSYKMCIVGVSCPSANRSAFQTDSEGCSNNWELLAQKVTVKSSKSLGGGIHSGHASAVEETIWVANIRTLWT